MPTRPRASTEIAGVNASCAPVGVSLALTGVDQLCPSSRDEATRTSSRLPLEKRTSCHVAYRVPSDETANDGTVSPVRRPGTGSDCMSMTRRAGLNVCPPSVDRVIQRLWLFLPRLPLSKYVPRTATSPLGKTTGTLPMVCLFVPVSNSTRGVEKLAPLLVERENIAGPVNVPTNGWPSGSSISRSQ